MTAFASWGERIFALLMLLPLLFFGGCAVYLWRLLLSALRRRGQVSRLLPPERTSEPGQRKRPAGLADSTDRKRFVLLIPAHDEALVLGAALESLAGLEYPPEAYQAIVIADNCSDRTAEIAGQHGAITLERFDTEQIGKGYALEWALNRLLSAAQDAELQTVAAFDAIVILDADTLVAPNLLTAFETGLNAGQQAMQARYEVLNAGESWRTRLMSCALALAHIVKPLGREQLGLSDGLKGNGMCFARSVVTAVAWSGASITEDIEYTLRLCRAGVRIAFLPETAVWAQMPTTGAQSVSQRKRWEGGRYQLLTRVAPQLLGEGFRKHDRILRDRAMELIIPPFAEMFAVPVLLLLVSGAAGLLFGWHGAWGLAGAWAVVLLMQAGYLFGGLWVARVPAGVAFSILAAPVYIVWKLGVYVIMAVNRSAGGWKRTERREL